MMRRMFRVKLQISTFAIRGELLRFLRVLLLGRSYSG